MQTLQKKVTRKKPADKEEGWKHWPRLTCNRWGTYQNTCMMPMTQTPCHQNMTARSFEQCTHGWRFYAVFYYRPLPSSETYYLFLLCFPFVCVSTFMCVHPPATVHFASFVTGSLIEPIAQQLCQAGWLAGPTNLPVLNCIVLGVRMCIVMPGC